MSDSKSTIITQNKPKDKSRDKSQNKLKGNSKFKSRDNSHDSTKSDSLPDSSISKDNAFLALGLSARVVRPLAVLGISVPTPIQNQAIPLVLAGHDVMGLAQTGTGKTAAFGLPLVHRLLESEERPKPKTVTCLILAPTRELVNQIADNIRGYVKRTPVWVTSVVGGQSINNQIRHLSKGSDILVATPGRLLDLVDRKALDLSTAQYLVLDEADQMLDLGFIHALRKIAKLLGTPRQTLLFSATMPKAVEELSRAYLNDPVRVQVAPPGKAADKVKQCVHFVQTKGKADLLKSMLAEREDDLSLVFARTKHGAEKLMKHLVAEGFAAASIHGNKSQGQRDRALRSFKKGDVRILVATDVAARGIDITGVSHVYNYNLPEVPENYIHRIGRTARAGREGEAIAFCSPEERKLLRQIEKIMNVKIPVGGTDGSENIVAPDKPVKRGRGGGGNRGGDGNYKKKRKPHRGGDGKPAHKKNPRRGKDGIDRNDRNEGAEGAGKVEKKSFESPQREGEKRNRPKRKPHQAKGSRNEPSRTEKFSGGKPYGKKSGGESSGSGKPVSGKPRSSKPGGNPGGGKPRGGNPGGGNRKRGGKGRGAPRG